jgi:hypothetical protein
MALQKMPLSEATDASKVSTDRRASCAMPKSHKRSRIFADSPCRHTPWRLSGSHSATGLQQDRPKYTSERSRRRHSLHRRPSTKPQREMKRGRPSDRRQEKQHGSTCSGKATTVRKTKNPSVEPCAPVTVTVTARTGGRRTAPFSPGTPGGQNWPESHPWAVGAPNAHHIRGAAGPCASCRPLGQVWSSVGRTREPSQNGCEGTLGSANQLLRRWEGSRGRGPMAALVALVACERPLDGGDVT